MTLIEELRQRGLCYAMTDDALEQKLEQETLTFYLGADASADSLHIGHLVPYIVARHLASRGHQPILLVGGGTALVGDPSGKKEERTLLDEAEVASNADAMTKQVMRLLPNATIVNNFDWIKDYSLIGFLRNHGKHFGLNQMLAKDSVKSRLETGISFAEFTYQILQSVDFWELYRNHGCTLQIGGQDQWGNITAGLELIRRTEGAEAKAYGMVAPLLTKADGTKFGKTEEGTVWLSPERTSPYAFYQHFINVDDADVIDRLKQFTMLSLERISELEHATKENPHLREAQRVLAHELTRYVHGDDALKQAENITEALFNNDVTSLSEAELAMAFEGIDAHAVKGEISLVDALIGCGLATSRRDARTMITQRAVSLNGNKVADEALMLTPDTALHGTTHVLRRGKKRYGVIRHKVVRVHNRPQNQTIPDETDSKSSKKKKDIQKVS